MNAMPMNSGRHAIIDDRRLMVARLLLRGLTQREIVTGLASQGKVNPVKGTPWSVGVINKDVRIVREGWQQEARATYDEYVAEIQAQIRAVRREAWRERDYDLVLRCLKQERDLIGLDKAKTVIVDWREQARADGIEDPDAVFEDIVQHFETELARVGDPGGNGGGSPTDGKEAV